MISIIVPVYNTSQFLDRCLQSLVSQTYKDIEIILIDDCSTDNSADIIHVWEKKDNRIKAIYKDTNSGVSDSRNIGLKYAKGEYIGFVDSDDWIDTNMYQIMMKSLKDNNADIAICSIKKEYQKQSRCLTVPGYDSFVDRNKAFQTCLKFIGTGDNNMYMCNKLFKKCIIANDHRFRTDIHYCEDVLWVAEAFCVANKFVFCPQTFYNYRCEREGNSTSLLNRGIIDPIKAYRLVYEELKKKSVPSANVAYQRMLAYKNSLIILSAKTGNKKKFKLGSDNYIFELLYWMSKVKSLYAFKWIIRRILAYLYYILLLNKNRMIHKI